MKEQLTEMTSSGSVATSMGGQQAPIKNASIYGNDKPGTQPESFANSATMSEYKIPKQPKEK